MPINLQIILDNFHYSPTQEDKLQKLNSIILQVQDRSENDKLIIAEFECFTIILSDTYHQALMLLPINYSFDQLIKTMEKLIINQAFQ